ncbi:MAG: N-acetyltransferase [Verrucomicrobiales bacterium]|nr:N-acetyltransferase [Verrucomicrobiales bacterium]
MEGFFDKFVFIRVHSWLKMECLVLEKNLTIKMIRENLENLPDFAPPVGYSIRWFQSGDEAAWLRIQSAAEKFHQITPDTFVRVFGRNAAWLSQRLCFLLDPAGNPIGTGAAWFDDNFDGRKFGRIHWMAVVPEYQGRGLGGVLMTAVCRRLIELKHTNAYLITSSARLAAIRLYLRFGFAPLIRNQADEILWQELVAR